MATSPKQGGVTKAGPSGQSGPSGPSVSSVSSSPEGPVPTVARVDVAEDGFGPVRLEQGGRVEHPDEAPKKSAGAPTAQSSAARVPSVRNRGPRRAKLQLRHVTPWTVFRFACVLSVSLFVVWMLVIGLLYGVLDAGGVIGDINRSVTTISPNSGAVVTPGRVLLYSTLIGLVNAVLFIALSTVGSYVYNLCADLVGGIEVTLSEREF
jgi:hypothetical protein